MGLLHRARGAARRIRTGYSAASTPPPEPPRPFTIQLDYPVQPNARHGYGRPAHPEIDALLRDGHERYRSTLNDFCKLQENLARIPVTAEDPRDPFWTNGWFQGVDFVA